MSKWYKLHKKRLSKAPYLAKIFRENLLSRLTPSEKLLYETLKETYKEPIFIQHVIYSYFTFFIIDIYLPSVKLAIEVDGKYHEEFKQRDQDRIKEITLLQKGISLVRFKNEEIQQDVKSSINEIHSIIKYLRTHRNKFKNRQAIKIMRGKPFRGLYPLESGAGKRATGIVAGSKPEPPVK